MTGWTPRISADRKRKLLAREQIEGFSLTELLVVIAIIAIIVAIVIPSISNISGQANDAKNQRNAQTIASLASAARAAGVTNIFTVDNVFTNLFTGVSTNGLFFGISPLSDSDIEGAREFLTNSAPPASVVFVPKPE